MVSKKLLRKSEERWCELEVKLSFFDDGKPDRLTICGSEGSLQCGEDLREMAQQYWEGFFEDSPEELGGMFSRFQGDIIRMLQEERQLDGSKHTAESAAAAVVLKIDGEFHGLDVEGDEDSDGDYRVTESCGQIRDELAKWFPKIEPWLEWHLNDLNAGCDHQRALGWGRRGNDITLDQHSCTPVQLTVLDHDVDNPFMTATFEDSVSAPCPECGYRYGSAWLRRELPPEVVEWFNTLSLATLGVDVEDEGE